MNWVFLLHLIRVVSESTEETVYMKYICSIHYSLFCLSVCYGTPLHLNKYLLIFINNCQAKSIPFLPSKLEDAGFTPGRHHKPATGFPRRAPPECPKKNQKWQAGGSSTSATKDPKDYTRYWKMSCP